MYSATIAAQPSEELSERTEQQQNPCPVTLGDTRRSQNAPDCSEFHVLELFLGNGDHIPCETPVTGWRKLLEASGKFDAGRGQH